MGLGRDERGRWRPWRQVVHIETRDTRGGGRCWFLTLECGHFKAVSIPYARPAVHLLGLFSGKRRLAPERVRCIVCEGEGLPQENGRTILVDFELARYLGLVDEAWRCARCEVKFDPSAKVLFDRAGQTFCTDAEACAGRSDAKSLRA